MLTAWIAYGPTASAATLIVAGELDALEADQLLCSVTEVRIGLGQLERSGPHLAAGAFVHALVDHDDLIEAWPHIDPDLRLARVQTYLMATDPRLVVHEIALDLASEATGAHAPGNELWPGFAEWCVQHWYTLLGSVLPAYQWQVVDHHEPIGHNLAIVVTADRNTDQRPGKPARAQIFTVRLNGGRWRVAGFGRTIAHPGWPPTEEEVPEPFGPT